MSGPVATRAYVERKSDLYPKANNPKVWIQAIVLDLATYVSHG